MSKWPKKVKRRSKVLAKIYRACRGRDSYRLTWYATGVFDILTHPAPELGAAERAEVKKVARELLVRLKSLLVLNWRQKAGARAQLKPAIEDVLDTGLPSIWEKSLYDQKCSTLLDRACEREFKLVIYV